MKRHIQIRFVKTKKDDTTEVTEHDLTFEGKAKTISKYFDRSAMKVGKAVIGYVVADTVRKVIILQASKR